jgi:hypothetical protein
VLTLRLTPAFDLLVYGMILVYVFESLLNYGLFYEGTSQIQIITRSSVDDDILISVSQERVFLQLFLEKVS